MKTVIVSVLLVGVALASPIIVRDRRNYGSYGLIAPGFAGHGLLAQGLAGHGLLSPGLFPLGYPGAAGILAPGISAPAVPAVEDSDYSDSYDDGSYREEPAAPFLAPALSHAVPLPPALSGAAFLGPGAETSAATFPDLDAPVPEAPTTTPVPTLAGPTLDGPVVPPFELHGPSGTIRAGALSTGAVSLAAHQAANRAEHHQ